MRARSRQAAVGLAAGAVLSAAAGAAPLAAAAPAAHVFNRVATLPAYLNAADPTQEAVAEISTVTEDGQTVVYTDAAGERIGFVDIADPHSPKPTGTLAVAGEPTSVLAVGPYLLVAVDTSESYTDPSGQLVVIDAESRLVLEVIELGASRTRSARARTGRTSRSRSRISATKRSTRAPFPSHLLDASRFSTWSARWRTGRSAPST